MAKIDKVISIKVEGVRRIKELEDSLKKLRKEQRENKKQTEGDANRYSKTAKSIKEQSSELRGLRKQMAGVNETTKKGNKLQDSMFKGVVKGAAAFSILVTAFRRVNQAMTSMISTFTEFEFTMAKVRAVSGATDEQFIKLSKSAEELGRTTFFTASQVAELQLNFSKLGFTTQEILNAQEATINLSIATGSDLARAATVAGSAIRGFGLDAEEAKRVVDVMAVSFTSSALDIEKFQTAMTKVAPIASMAGFTIEETTAIMSKLADTGIEASIAGTSLRNIFLKMQDPSSELSRKLGRTINNLDEMLIAFQELQDEGTDLADVLTFMDVRQVAAFGTMLRGSEDIRILRDELVEADGAGQRMADTVGDTLQGSIFRVKSAIEGFSIALVKNFGESMKATLTRLADFLNNLVESERKIEILIGRIKFLGKAIVSTFIGFKMFSVFASTASASTSLFTRSVTAATTALKTFGRALGAFGIGIAVLSLIEYISSFIKFKNEVEEAVTAQERLNNAITEGEEDINKVNIQTKRLVELKEKEKKLNKENIVDAKLLKRNQREQAKLISEINKERQKHNLSLIDEKTNIDNIIKSTDDLIEKMKDLMLAQIFQNLSAEILQEATSARLIADQFASTAESFNIGGHFLTAAEGMDITISSLLGGSDIDTENEILLDNLLKQYGLTIAQFAKIIESDDYYSEQVGIIQESLQSMLSEGGSLFLTGTGDNGDGGTTSAQKSAIKSLENFLKEANTITNHLRQEGIISQKEYDSVLLESQLDAVDNFLTQEGIKFDEEVRAREQRSKILLKIQQNTYNEQLRQLDENFANNQLSLDEQLANGLITEIQHKEALLKLESGFLIKKMDLNQRFGKVITDELLRQGKIDIENINLRKEALDTFIDNVSNVGDAIQSLAGDEEKLQALRKVGVKITQAAAIAEQVLALKKQLVTLAESAQTKEKVKGQAVSAASIITNLRESASEGVKAASTFAAGVAKAFAKNPIAGLAALAVVIGILSKLRGMFKNPNLATGSTDSAGSGDSSGGSSGGIGGNSMTLLSYQGTGSTFANGGMVYGNSHTNGGEKFAVGGRVVELEGGEAVINKRSTAMFRSQLSAMNSAGGGVKFADGGIANSPSFAQTQFDVMGQSMMSSGGRVTVVEADITSTQNSVKTIESEASF